VPESAEEIYRRSVDALRTPPVEIWDEVLPPTPKDPWEDNLARVVRAMG
jgi:hypothetical protein